MLHGACSQGKQSEPAGFMRREVCRITRFGFSVVPDQASMPGVRTVMRVRQCRQDTSRAFLKWSRGELLTMMLSAMHEGQVNRIT